MAVSTTAGTRYFVGPVINPDLLRNMTDTAAVDFFEDIEAADWKEVEEVEDYGEVGDASEESTFTSVANRRVRKIKSTRNAGTMALVVGRDPLDEGQQALVAAEKTDFNYAFRIEYADARDEDHTDSIEYFGGMVMSRPTNIGNVSNVTRRTFSIGINTAVYEVISEPITPP